MRWPALALLAALCALLAPAPASAADARLTQAIGSRFPERTWVLTLPTRQALKPSDLEIRENGRQVQGLTLAAGDGSGRSAFGVMLVIDASNSMRGRPIRAAMLAAREFAAHRPPGQSLGVLFFSNKRTVGLPLTQDPAKIDAALAGMPDLSGGTRIYDAGLAAVEMLRDARTRAGSIVLLSDGDDVGSRGTEAALASAARNAHVRFYTVGLRSKAFQPATLRDLATSAEGAYVEAGSSGDLKNIYAALGDQLSREYLVTYRSLAPASSDITVKARVDGLDETILAGYHTPALPLAPAPPAPANAWGDPKAVAGAIGLIAALLGVALWVLIRGRRATAVERVADYVAAVGRKPEPDEGTARGSLMKRLENLLLRGAWWPRVTRAVELADIGIGPAKLVIATAGATLLAMWLCAAAGRPVASLLFAFTPVPVWLYVKARIERRRRAFVEQLPDNLQVVASALRAGHSFESGLAVAAEDAAEPMRTELKRVIADERLGVPLQQAMTNGAERMASREFEQVGMVVALQREAGGNTAEILDQVVESLRYRGELHRMVRTLTAQGRMGGIVVTALPVGLALLMSIIAPGYFDPMLDNLAGQMLLGFAAVLVGIGWLVIRKVVDIKI